MAYNVYFDEVNIGDQLPDWARKTDFMNWNRYAAVNDEFIPIHMDDEAGRAALNEAGAFGMGNLRYAYMVNALQTWIGDEAEVREIGCEFRAINQKNDVLTVVGKVTEMTQEAGECRIRLQIVVVNQAGQPTCPGHAIVVVPASRS